MGLVIKNVILLVDCFLVNEEKGMVWFYVVWEVGIFCLRLILMIIFLIMVGMLFIVLELGVGGLVRSFMVIVVIGGLIVLMLLMLVVVFVLFSYVDLVVKNYENYIKV